MGYPCGARSREAPGTMEEEFEDCRFVSIKNQAIYLSPLMGLWETV